MKKYNTVSGDVWDWVAYKKLGNCLHMEKLINANREMVSTFVFKAGEELTLPEIDTTKVAKLPPWRR